MSKLYFCPIRNKSKSTGRENSSPLHIIADNKDKAFLVIKEFIKSKDAETDWKFRNKYYDIRQPKKEHIYINKIGKINNTIEKLIKTKHGFYFYEKYR